MSASYRLQRTQFIPRPREEVFAFFGDPHNLERITPSFLHFRIETPASIPMRAGTLIDYRLRLYGLPIRWRTRIESFEAPHRFVDVQLRGPYRRWVHRHEFEAVECGTRMQDLVDYELPYGPVGRLIHALFVRRSLAAIFAHRAQAIAEFFPPQSLDSMRNR